MTVPVWFETGPSGTWRFSSDMGADVERGASLHGDWMSGWDDETMRTIVANCSNRAVECGVGLLGDGTRLRPVPLD